MSEESGKVVKQKKPPVSGKIDISDAVVLEEKDSKETKKEGSETIDSTDSYTKNLKDQKVVDLGETGKKQVGEKTTIDFMSEEHINSFTASNSKKSEENTEDTKSKFDGKSVEDLQKEIKEAEKDSSKNFTAKDFEDIARFLIFLIDTGISSGLKWWGKDTSDTAYSLPEKKKEMLVYQLTLILTKYQAKFSIEFMFIATILLVYAPAFMKAKRRRTELKNQPIVTKDVSHVVVKENENVNNEEVKTTTEVNTGPKRKRGNPGKA